MEYSSPLLGPHHKIAYRLGPDKDVWNVFVLAEQRQMQDDLQWLRIGSHDDEFGDAAVQRLRRLIGAWGSVKNEIAQIQC